MRHSGKAIIGAVAALAMMLISASGASAAAFDCSVPLDNFDRANSATLGSSWTEQSPTMSVEGNSATNPASNAALATWNATVPTQQACADVTDNGASVQYAALALGYSNLTNAAFVKVQDNSAAGNFDTAYFYYGNNGSCQITGGCAVPIAAFHAARLHASLNAATGQVTLDIDTNFDNVPDQSITKTYNTPFAFGNAIGIGVYGHAFMDNFATAPAPTPTPTPTPTPPPDTKLLKSKIDSKHGAARFKFKAVGQASGFQCALVKKHKTPRFKPCTSPKSYKKLKPGKYTFKVRAVGPGGTDSTPATKNFVITG